MENIHISKPDMNNEEKSVVLDTLSSGILAQGPKVKAFENEFSDYVGTNFGIATNSGTSALKIALKSLGLKAGDEVITTPFTFIATANSILSTGAKPVFIDVCEDTFNIDPKQIESKITPKIKALVVVHLFGLPCQMDIITQICEDHKLYFIEDACQAHGAMFKGKKVGSFGNCACFSFYPTKNITTCEGGMITTNEEDLKNTATVLRNHGARSKDNHDMLGYNDRMTDLAASIGLVQLQKLDKYVEKRRRNAAFFDTKIKKEGLILPIEKKGFFHSYNQYTLRVTDECNLTRDELKEALEEKRIFPQVYYPLMIPQQKLYQKLGYNSKDLNVAKKLCSEVLSIPVYPGLQQEQLQYIVDTINAL